MYRYMVETKKIELEVSVGKVVSLYDNEVLEEQEAIKLLQQFNKKDLIAGLLSSEGEDEEEGEDEDEEDEGEDEEYELDKKEIIKESKKDYENPDEVDAVEAEREDEDLDDLDL